jgi:multidrug efflux pump subunit AcrA (membrane-fusion protein)
MLLKYGFRTPKSERHFPGVINRIPTKVGSLIEEGTLLTTLSQGNQVFAYFDVSEKEYLQYARSLKSDSAGTRKVALILADGQMHPEPGYIETIEGEIDENTGNIAFRARFNNPGGILRHGASGKIRQFRKGESGLADTAKVDL